MFYLPSFIKTTQLQQIRNPLKLFLYFSHTFYKYMLHYYVFIYHKKSIPDKMITHSVLVCLHQLNQIYEN